MRHPIIKKIVMGIGFALISSGFLFFYGRPDGLLHIYLLDVGQGDAILIRTPNGTNALIDGGPDKVVLGELADVLPFFDRSLDYIFLTHPDKDHIQGLIHVLRHYTVDRALFAGIYKKSSLLDAFLDEIIKKKIPLHAADAAEDILLEDGVFFDVLFPFSQTIDTAEKVNNYSLIVKIVYGENEILLAGDSEAEQEEKLLAGRADLAADILKVGHHGSKTSTSNRFLEAVKPSYAVISVGEGNSYHHPSPEILRKLEEGGITVLRTDKSGRIEMIFDRNGLKDIRAHRR